MNENKILQKLSEHDKRFDELASDLSSFKHQVLTSQDEVLTILKRLDEERIFMSRWVERIEDEIAKIKSHLKIN